LYTRPYKEHGSHNHNFIFIIQEGNCPVSFGQHKRSVCLLSVLGVSSHEFGLRIILVPSFAVGSFDRRIAGGRGIFRGWHGHIVHVTKALGDAPRQKSRVTHELPEILDKGKIGFGF
jgi:hypothetical protein